MKNILIIISTCLTTLSFSQSLDLTNVIVVGQQDRLKDQYNLELAVVELMRENDVNAIASLNVLPRGADPTILASDSLQRNLSNKGFDTFMLISVRGYDKRFNPPTNVVDMREELSAGHLFQLWRESAATITFTVTFYRNNVPAHYELIRVRARNSQDKMIKGLYKKMQKRLLRAWK